MLQRTRRQLEREEREFRGLHEGEQTTVQVSQDRRRMHRYRLPAVGNPGPTRNRTETSSSHRGDGSRLWVGKLATKRHKNLCLFVANLPYFCEGSRIQPLSLSRLITNSSSVAEGMTCWRCLS